MLKRVGRLILSVTAFSVFCAASPVYPVSAASEDGTLYNSAEKNVTAGGTAAATGASADQQLPDGHYSGYINGNDEDTEIQHHEESDENSSGKDDTKISIISTVSSIGKVVTNTAVATGMTFVINTTTEVSYTKVPHKIKITKCVRKGKHKILVKWKNKRKYEGYKIVWSSVKKKFPAKNRGFSLDGTGKFIIKHLKADKKYYVKVTAFNYDAAGDRICGPWSRKKRA